MHCFDELLDELHLLEHSRGLNKSLNFYAPTPRPRADSRPALKTHLADLDRLAKALTPPPTPAEKAAAQRDHLIKRCRAELPCIVAKSKANFLQGRITGESARLNEIAIHHLTDRLALHGIRL